MSAAVWSRTGAAPRPTSWIPAYGLSVASVALALLVTIALNRPEIRGPLFIPAILISAWYGGVGPGLLAVTLSVASIDLFLTPRRHSLQLVLIDDVLYVAVFAVSALIVTWITGAQRRTEVALRTAHGDLTANLEELRRTNERLEGEVTERTRAEAEVYRQASLLDLTHDSVIARDAEGVITYWNRGAEERYQWTRAEALGRSPHALLRTSFPAPLGEVEAELHRTGHWEGELVHTRRDGSRIVVASRWSLSRDADGRPAGVLETNNDITERKRAEHVTNQVFEVSPDEVSIVGRDYRYRRVNSTHQRVWGVPAERFVGARVSDMLGDAVFGQTIRPNLDRCLAGEEVSDSTWFERPAGRRYLLVSYSPLRSTSSSEVDAALVIGRDLTEHMEAIDALQRSQAELAHVSRLTMLGEVTASIAHEINQPLAAVVMNGNACRRWLDAEPPELGEAREAALRVVGDGERAGTIIERIRALARRRMPERVALDIGEVIGEAIAFTRVELDRQGVAVDADVGEGLLVLGDRIQLQQVLVNLLLNAGDAMADVGVPSRRVGVASRRERTGQVLVEVSDRGRGLDPATAARIFEPFFSTKANGLGMGLSISRSIVGAHGGRMWAASNDAGPGATVRFTLPAAPGGD
jgi:PAS domain S-box-containing protein